MTNSTIDHRGFIVLHRKMQDNWLWLSEPFSKSQAWIDLLLSANHKDGSFLLRGIKIDLKRGQLSRGEEILALRWKWSKGKLRNFLKLLESEQQIKLHRSNKINIIEIVNYNSYQEVNNKVVNKKSAERLENGQQNDSNNNVNNVNNENNDKQIIYDKLADGLKFVLESKLNRKISSNNWDKEIKLLIEKDLSTRDNAVEDVKRVIQKIADSFGEQYFPVIQSASSLREKFSKVEAAIQRGQSQKTQSNQDIYNNLGRKYDNE